MPPKRKRAAAVEEVEIAQDHDLDEESTSKIKVSGKANSKRKREKVVKQKEESTDGDDSESEKKPVKKTKGRNAKKVDKSELNENSNSDDFESEEKPIKKGSMAKKDENSEEESEPEEKPAKKGRMVKKKDVSNSDESEPEEKPAKRGKMAKNEDNSNSEESEPEEKPVKGRGRSKAKATKTKPKAGGDPPKAKNQTSTSYSDVDFTSCRKSINGSNWNYKISSWNVDGIRAWIKKGGLEYIHVEKPDILCLQETKCSTDKLPVEAKEVDGYKVYWHCSEKEGYAGVGLYTKTEPISVTYGLGVEEHDNEGRMITAEYDEFYIISVYVPNAGRGLVTLPKRLDWNEEFKNYIAKLDKKKPVIIAGDMNVAHQEIDLTNPKTNTKSAGFTKEERNGMTDFLREGYIDTFRKIYPDQTQAYTFWSYMANCRNKNIGWRLDYFIVSERFADSVCDNIIRSKVFGSDHCPITLFLSV